jgi:hypothetical protein
MDDQERARRREVIAAARDTIARCQECVSPRRAEEQLGIRRRMWNPGDEPDAMERWRSLPRQEQEEERKASTSSETDTATAQRWNEWADTRIWSAIGETCDMLGAEVAETQKSLLLRIAKLEAEIVELRGELQSSKAERSGEIIDMPRFHDAIRRA